ncbi:TetR/AcrR family transcriptional regulator [Paenibacillus alvei]|uniref:TetR/AcrR family transcriptional regulator n=1 Tax=Paenibacillus alvei TaxID=44250 RepID=UPI00227E8BC1|nr:TetR/AcrR family transcriptional regulator [Paenibacillus alvei]
MNSKFITLSTEKQDRIINEAMKEFVRKGYEHASTNEMVKGAGISKGLLFHYFNNKQELFLSLYDYGVEKVMSLFYGRINLEEKDFFIRFRQVQQVRWELLMQYPELFKFLNAAYVETASDIRPHIEQRNKGLTQEAFGKVLAGFDRSKFKEGLDIDKAINIIVWTFHGFLKDKMKRANTMQINSDDYVHMVKEADEYIDMFRQSFYN